MHHKPNHLEFRVIRITRSRTCASAPARLLLCCRCLQLRNQHCCSADAWRQAQRLFCVEPRVVQLPRRLVKRGSLQVRCRQVGSMYSSAGPAAAAALQPLYLSCRRLQLGAAAASSLAGRGSMLRFAWLLCWRAALRLAVHHDCHALPAVAAAPAAAAAAGGSCCTKAAAACQAPLQLLIVDQPFGGVGQYCECCLHCVKRGSIAALVGVRRRHSAQVGPPHLCGRRTGSQAQHRVVRVLWERWGWRWACEKDESARGTALEGRLLRFSGVARPRSHHHPVTAHLLRCQERAPRRPTNSAPGLARPPASTRWLLPS